MNSAVTSLATSNGAASNPFVPMTESQMQLAKGGTDFPGIFELFENASEAVQTIVETFVSQLEPFDLNEDYWDELSDELSDEGYIIPPWEALGDGQLGF